jgi:TP901 family phage tail tape measure protein|nr:MAG TPA: tail tape measure protein [Caudoviricetes sp.]
MNNNDIKTVTLTINSEQAQRKLDDINRRLEQARLKRQDAFDRGDGKALQAYAKEIKSLETQATRLSSRAQTVEKVLRSLDSATPKELKATIKEINRELNSGNVERGSEQWQALTRSLQEANKELQKIKDEQKAANDSSFITKIGQTWSGVAVVFDSIAGKFSALKQAMAEYVNEYADMAEHMSGVKKYTGLTDEAVQQLNDDFMKMDTRTAREQLNDLAGDAGRLGIQSKQQILDFVQAADQINVALGEDLGEDAVKNIGKLAQLFGDADKMGLKQAMLSSASVINELAQSSSASEAYLMDFTARLAGVGKQAGMTQAQVMAFGSVLDQNMVNVERGATALQNVITALYAKPATMAKVAGLNVKEFTQLLKTDGNAALLQFVDALRKAGKMDALAPMLTDMKLSGAGVTQTLSTLAANIDTLKQTQQQATQAFAQGSSVTKEFNTANNTAQAQLEKAQKRMEDLRVELGERLYPIYTAATNGVLNFVGATRTVITFVASHAKTITTAAVAMGVFTLAVQANVVWTNICAAATSALTIAKAAYTTVATAATVATTAFNVALKSNGFGAIISLILSAVAALGTWLLMTDSDTEATKANTKAKKDNAQASDEQRRKQKLLKSIQKDSADNAKAERAQIEMLTNVIHDNSASIDSRRKAIAKLQSIVPGYQASLSSSGTLVEKNTKAIGKYIEQLDRLALAQALFKKLQENAEKQFDIDRAIASWQKAVAYRDKQMQKDGHSSQNDQNIQRHNKARLTWWQLQGILNKKENKFIFDYAKSHGVQGELAKIITNGGTTPTTPAITPVTTTSSNSGGNSGGNSSGNATHTTKNTTDPVKAQLKALEDAANQQRLIARANYENGIIDHREYSAQLLDIDQKLYTDQRNLYTENSPEWVKLEQKRYDATAAVRKNNHAWSIHELDIEEQNELNTEKQNYLDGITNEVQYQSNKTEIRLRYLKRRANLSKLYGQDEEAKKYQQQYDTETDNDKLQRQKEFWQRVDQARKEWFKKSADEQKADELKFAEELHKKGILTEKEYQKAKKEIEEKYKDKDTNLGQPTDAMSQSVINLAQNLSNLSQKLKDGKAQWQDYAAVGMAAMSMIMATMSQASQLFQAQSQLEQAEVTKRYDAQIKAAGKNTKRTKKLEEQKQAELAKIKSKYNRKQMKVQLAQAVAQTAMNAIMAYGSVVNIPVVGPIMAPIAAAAAVAAGAIQIAAIKKQHQAEAEGYYIGGFTGGRQYRRQAGIVHEGEFVANHQAVNNPHLMPVLQLIDHAQRTNTVARLTADDVSRAITAPQTTANLAGQAITTAATAANNTPALQVVDTATPAQTDAINQLNQQLAKGIKAYVVMSGPDGFDQQYTHYKKLTNP